jgi:hypothetical protein
MLHTVQRPRRPQASARPEPPASPHEDLAGLTCSDIEAIVYARLPDWLPPAGSAQEVVEAAAMVGFFPGLTSQIRRSE